MERLFKSVPFNGNSNYVLLLDDLNDVRIGAKEGIINEITAAVNEWSNVRIIMSGRKVPKERIFDSLDKVEVSGVSDMELSEYEDMTDQIKDLLKLPPILNEFKSGKHRTVGELLDRYFMQYEKSRYSDNAATSFMIEIVLLFIAKRMKDFPFTPLRCGDVFEIMGTVTKLMLKNNSVYLNYIVQKGYNEESLPTGRDELINIILETGIIISDEYGALSFETNIYRDYFAAKYVINAIEMLDISFGKDDVDGKSELFNALHFNDAWFSDNSMYRLIGEIVGDYRNTPDSAHYYKTPLDTLLKMCGEIGNFRTTENIIKAMASVRSNEICDVDFINTEMPFSIPSYIKFSDKDGELPCSFCNCQVMFINLLEPLKFSVSSDNNRCILAAFENAYFVLWDTENEQIVWDNDFSECVDEYEKFECAEFTDNYKFILVSNSNKNLKIEASSGDLCGQYSHEECYSKSYDEYCENNCVPQNVVDEELHLKILQQLSHFKNCIFTGVDFAFDEYRRILGLMRAIVD